MKKGIKFLALVLALVLFMGVIPRPGLAAESGDPPTSGEKTSITVTTRDAKEPSKLLADCGIQLERVTAGRYENIGTLYTNQTGSVTWNQLEPGWYRITQVTVPPAYKENNTPLVRWFGSDSDNHLVTFENRAKNALTIKRVANGNKPVANVGFEVRDTNDGVVFSGSTDATGTVYVPNLTLETIRFGKSSRRMAFIPSRLHKIRRRLPFCKATATTTGFCSAAMKNRPFWFTFWTARLVRALSAARLN